MNMNVAVFFFTDAAVLAKKGVFTKISKEMGRRFNLLAKNEKAEFYVCEQAARKRSITRETIENRIKIIGYPTFLDMATSAKTVITI